MASALQVYPDGVGNMSSAKDISDHAEPCVRVKESASRAPEWASLEPPYGVKQMTEQDKALMEQSRFEQARREQAIPIRIERIERMLIAICESLTSHTAVVVRELYPDNYSDEEETR